jgi:hypothetical protein
MTDKISKEEVEKSKNKETLPGSIQKKHQEARPVPVTGPDRWRPNLPASPPARSTGPAARDTSIGGSPAGRRTLHFRPASADLPRVIQNFNDCNTDWIARL